MNDSLNSRVYTKFQKHSNNANEIVNATHMNNVQNAIVETETNLNNVHDAQYMDKVLFTFNNNLFVNSLFANESNDKTYINFSKSNNAIYDENENSISVSTTTLTAEIYTSKITSTFGDGVLLNDFYLTTDEYIPVGSSIKYYLVNQNNENYPIPQNSTIKPIHINSDVANVTVRAVMTKNAMGESPILYGLCLMFFDPAVESSYGLYNPDLKRFSSTVSGLTVLIRDRANDDRLFQIQESDGITSLNYSNNGVLSCVIKDNTATGQTITDTLNYGDYLNSQGNTEVVLLSILSTTVTTDNVSNDTNYTFSN